MGIGSKKENQRDRKRLNGIELKNINRSKTDSKPIKDQEKIQEMIKKDIQQMGNKN